MRRQGAIWRRRLAGIRRWPFDPVVATIPARL